MVTLADSFVQGLEFMRNRGGTLISAANNSKSNATLSNSNANQPQQQLDNNIITTSHHHNFAQDNNTTTTTVVSPSSLSQHPAKQNLRTRVNNLVLKTLEQNTDKDYSRNNLMMRRSNTDFVNALGDSETLRNYIMSRTIVITNVRKCENIVNDIMAHDTEIGLDCEGVNLGRDGEMTLIQIARPDGSVYIFDVLTQSKMADVMKELLESEKIVKVHLFDC